MIGRLEKTVIDCPDPRALAAFSAELLGMRVNEDGDDRAEQAVLALGGRRLPAERESGFRVFADPVGHPFCLVFG
jgi:hypothetical protein